MKEYDLIWLAGLLEGEGSFLKSPPSRPNCPAITLMMTDEDVVAKAAMLFGSTYRKCKKQKAHHKTPYATALKGGRAVVLMKELQPHMGLRRKEQINLAINSYNPVRKTLKPNVKTEIVERYKNGESAVSISKVYGITRFHVHKLARQFKCDQTQEVSGQIVALS
jgi:hypothetical protein